MGNYVVVLETIGTVRIFGPFTSEEFKEETHKYPENYYTIKYFSTLEKANSFIKKLNL